MPFKSEAQRKWMHANRPDMAARWEEETPNDRRLPAKIRHEEDPPKRRKPPKRWAKR
jgi:hypothetical protein